MNRLRLLVVRSLRRPISGAWTLILLGLFSHSNGVAVLGLTSGLGVLESMDHETLVRINSPWLAPERQRLFEQIHVSSVVVLAMFGFIALMDHLHAWP